MILVYVADDGEEVRLEHPKYTAPWYTRPFIDEDDNVTYKDYRLVRIEGLSHAESLQLNPNYKSGTRSNPLRAEISDIA